MESDEICKDIAQAIRKGYFYAGEHSGFSAQGVESIEIRLQKLVAAIKQELKQEIRNEQQ